MQKQRKQILIKEFDKLFNLLHPPKEVIPDYVEGRAINEFVFGQTTTECFRPFIYYVEDNFHTECNVSSFSNYFVTSTKDVKLGNLFTIRNPQLLEEEYLYLPEDGGETIGEDYTFVWDYDIHNKVFLSKNDYSCPYQATTWYYIFLGTPDEYKNFRRSNSLQVKTKLDQITEQMRYEKLLYCLKKKQKAIFF